MRHDLQYQQQTANVPRILLNSYTDGNIEGEAFVTDHIFSYIISGKHEVWLSGIKYTFGEGDFRFFRSNQLARYVKSPVSGVFRSVAVHMDQYTLRAMSEQYGLKKDQTNTSEVPLLIHPDNLLRGYVDSLQAYLHLPQPDQRLITLKTQELVLLLIKNDTRFKNILFDFSEPGKLDLEAFMNRHYRYNVSMERFAFLTGRSLSGFKRDFEKIYHTTPGKWLVQKRLQEAKWRIEDKKEKPANLYLDLGFEDLSHFSHAYKKAFRYAPNRKINIK
ncbi:helix-turn-helix domain-containing protein [Chitinophaga sp. Hz27]|uniref:helix-turn-helix domain-containing protein n=1 Tax=Chitinophaga sp. Hz27 TaxID=3347169 RepID=UPI0035DE2BD8